MAEAEVVIILFMNKEHERVDKESGWSLHHFPISIQTLGGGDTQMSVSHDPNMRTIFVA